MSKAASLYETRGMWIGGAFDLTDLNTLLHAMRGRYSSKPIDKVSAMAFLLQRYGSYHSPIVTLPIYDTSTSSSTAWAQLVLSITSTKFLTDDEQAHTPIFQLLCLFPHPSRHHWFPSWSQVQKYPDVSVRDSDQDPVLSTGGMDYSFRIVPGQIYQGCSFQLIEPPEAEWKATYRCTMSDKGVHLNATVPGIKLPIDSSRKYVLVDIRGVVIVCEEVDIVAQPTADTETIRVAEWTLVIKRYFLRRITTLEWDSRSHRTNDLKPSLVDKDSALSSRFYNIYHPRWPDMRRSLSSTSDTFFEQEPTDILSRRTVRVYEAYLV